MMFFKRKRIKLSLIDDYIKIMLINNFFNNSFENFNFTQSKEKFEKTKTTNMQLKITYEAIFEKLKLNDVSLLVLKKELKNNNFLFEQIRSNLDLENTLDKTKSISNEILFNLKDKMKTLKLCLNLANF